MLNNEHIKKPWKEHKGFIFYFIIYLRLCQQTALVHCLPAELHAIN